MKTNEVMNFEKFMDAMQCAVETRLGQTVYIHEVMKNNGVVWHGLSVKDMYVNISPTLYLELYYKDYLLYGMDAAVHKLICDYEDAKPTKSMDISFFTDETKVRSRIQMRLVNYESNREWLQFLPHKKYLDLAVIFTAAVDTCKDEAASIIIQNNHMEFWNITEDELFCLAMENTKYDYRIVNMRDILANFMSDKDFEQVFGEDANELQMYILSNYAKVHGATGILHKEILKNFMKEKSAEAVVIIPSSVHEVILVPYKNKSQMLNHSKMVKEVNDTQLEPEEVLSDHAYIFDGEKITIEP